MGLVDIARLARHVREAVRFTVRQAGTVSFLGDAQIRALCPIDDPRSLAHELLVEAGYETEDDELLGLPGQEMVWAWKSP